MQEPTKPASRGVRPKRGSLAGKVRAVLRGRTAASSTPTGDEAALTAVERLLVESPLFDEEWYSRSVGRTFAGKSAAVRHYVAKPISRRADPHPLFDRDHFVAGSEEPPPADQDPYLWYLCERRWERPTHPMFETLDYLRAHPDARAHPFGPLGHYQQIGAAEGLPANSWLVAGEGSAAGDLSAWLEERQREWQARASLRRRRWDPEIPSRRVRAFERSSRDHAIPAADGPLLSVVVDAGSRADHLADTLASIHAPVGVEIELILLAAGLSEAEEIARAALPQTTVVAVPASTGADGYNAALAVAAGRFVAFVRSGDRWAEGRLPRLLGALSHQGMRAAYDALALTDDAGETRVAFRDLSRGLALTHNDVDLSRVVVERDVAIEIGFDDSLPLAWDFDFVTRLFDGHEPLQVPVVGVRRDARVAAQAHHRPPGASSPRASDHADTWQRVVARRHLIDWEGLARTAGVPGRLSVVIPTLEDAASTEAAVAAVMADASTSSVDVECIVWDNGSSAKVAIALDALQLKYPGVCVQHSPVNHSFALGCDLGFAASTGEYVVFLHHDTLPQAGWAAALVAALTDPRVLGAQALLLSGDRTIHSAGVAFPSCGGIPGDFLAGFPEEDATCLPDVRFAALRGAALALRRTDVVAMRGFDPIFRNSLEDVDLCLRLGESKEGHFVVVPTARVVHFQTEPPDGVGREAQNRALFLERWASTAPRDDVDLWAAAGYAVADHETPAAERGQAHIGRPVPVLVRTGRLRPTLSVTETLPSLRWSIKNPAPVGDMGEKWGDTHFAAALAGALRGQGQEVVVDRRDAWERVSGRHDDVNLVLRGLSPFAPPPENVTIAWVISHPEMLEPSEAVAYDRVVAASTTWGAEQGAKWGIRIDPLLQATDPARFNPDVGMPGTGHPVLFVGGSRKTYRPVVMAAVEQGLPLSIYGYDWEDYVPPSVVKAPYLPNDQVGAAYRSAGVVLNDHWDDMRRAGFVSNRLFDAVAAGARVISDDVAGIKELFGDSVQVMREPADVVRLTSLADPDSVFGDDEARRETATRVARDHSFDARAAQLMEIALEARRARGFG